MIFCTFKSVRTSLNKPKDNNIIEMGVKYTSRKLYDQTVTMEAYFNLKNN